MKSSLFGALAALALSNDNIPDLAPANGIHLGSTLNKQEQRKRKSKNSQQKKSRKQNRKK